LANSSTYILLAEDNEGDILLVREALEDRAVDYRLDVVSDGDQAVKFIERIDQDSTLICPKLLLLDLHLPKRNGEEILQCLRSSERCAVTPVVVMSSSDSPANLNMARRYEALHYFRKPTTLEQFMKLGDLVKNIIGQNGEGPGARVDW
jgi:chemotaxis family two-component system response regulator Rcp1